MSHIFEAKHLKEFKRYWLVLATLLRKLLCVLNPFSTNVSFTDKPGSWFLLAKCLKNTCGRVTFYVKMQFIDLHLYVKCHYSAGVFQRFCQ